MVETILGQLIEDVGRLRRHLEPDTYADFLAFRLAGRAESLEAMLRPTAAELYLVCGDVEAVLSSVDEREAELRRTLYPRRPAVR